MKFRDHKTDRPKRSSDLLLQGRTYEVVSDAIREGRIAPGSKVTIRQVAELVGASMTPARQALSRLVEQGALDNSLGKSLRVPVMTVTRWDEIVAMRMALETLAISLSAKRITPIELAHLRKTANEITKARISGRYDRDRALVTRFQLDAYAGSHSPDIQRMIGDLWLVTGPYLRLLYPSYVTQVSTTWRDRLCDALERRDADAAKAEIERDLGEALAYIRDRASADGIIGVHVGGTS